MYRKSQLVAVLVLLVGAYAPAEDAPPPAAHPAERAYAKKLAEAKVIYETAATVARKELIDTLDKAVVEATKAGDLDGAILLRDRINALKTGTASPRAEKSPLTGRVTVLYSNGVQRVYSFREDSTVAFEAQSKIAGGPAVPFPKEARAPIVWRTELGHTVGYILRPEAPEIESVDIVKGKKATFTLFPGESAIAGQQQ